MLRITTVTDSDAVTLRVEGRLVGPWLDELTAAVERARRQSRRVGLDLSGVRYVDLDGAQVLRGLVEAGTAIVACSSFVAELLHVEKP